MAEALSGFSVPEVVQVARLKDGLSILELFHGRTLAFKDLAMTCTVRFLDYFLQKEKQRATVLVGERLLPQNVFSHQRHTGYLHKSMKW